MILAVNIFLETLTAVENRPWQGTHLSFWLTGVAPTGSKLSESLTEFKSGIKGLLPLDNEIYRWQYIEISEPGAEREFLCLGFPLDGEALEFSELLSKILDHSIDGMITVNTEGKILSFNLAAERLFGYEAREVLGKNVSMLMPLPYAEKHDDYMSAYLETGNAKIIGKGREVIGLRKDGMKFPFHLTITKPFQLGTHCGFLGIVRDLSQTKTFESQLRRAQKMESIGTLAGGIAHDFNNILGGISGYVELMLEDATPGSGFQEDLIEMKKACQRGRDLVLQILTFSRRDRAALEPMQLQPIVKESLKLLRATFPATIKVVEDFSDECPLIIGDVTQIHQVLMNLGTNAYHAMRKDGGVLTVRLKQVKLDDRYLGLHPNLSFGDYNLLQVCDTGHGIRPEHLQRIFDPFFTTKAVGDGTGMGLAVVHGIVQSHQGDILVESEPGKGSVFSLFFPVHRGMDVEELKNGSAVVPETGKEHLILVDDDAMLLRVESRILRRAGYKVSSFENGRLALNALLDPSQSFDLLITDQTMPEMTGTDLASIVLAQKPNFPIILTTGFSETVTADRIHELGICDLLMKPVGKNDLIQSIQKALNAQKVKDIHSA